MMNYFEHLGGPYAPFDQRWHLRQEYKVHSQRDKLAQQ
jgi:hypothetical protein